VEETERGWMVQYIERDPMLLERQETARRRAEAERIQEMKAAKRMELQRVEAAKALDLAGSGMNVEATGLERRGGAFSLNLKKAAGDSSTTTTTTSSSNAAAPKKRILSETELLEDAITIPSSSKSDACVFIKKPKKVLSALDQLMAEQSSSHKTQALPSNKQNSIKTAKNNNHTWLCKDILVRVISKKFSGGKYFKRKGVVLNVVGDSAELDILDSGPDVRDGGDIIHIQQEYLETVIPKVGKKVKILNGSNRGEVAKVLELFPKEYKGDLQIIQSKKVVKDVDYENMSKMSS